MRRILFFFLLITSCFSTKIYAQSCATLVVNSSSIPLIPCDPSKIVDISFNAKVDLNFPVNETDVYTVDSIPYSFLPWTGTNIVLNGTDDLWSDTVRLPFPFCFFGNTYDYYVIGSNGRISFDITLAGTFDNFSTNRTPPLIAPDPDPNYDMNNTIMAAYHDIDPSVGGSITWGIQGVAPCRRMVINWTTVPMFSCNNLIDSQQIVLYELSNVIDINIASKPICIGWNAGLALQGIQNSTGSAAYTTTGRNNTVWTANNDSRRYAPAGNPYPFRTTYTWRNVITNTLIDTGSSITLSAPFPPGIVCIAAIFGGCNTDTTFARDTTMFQQGVVNATFDTSEDSICLGDPLILSNTSTVNNVAIPRPQLLTSTWDMGDGNVFVNNNASFIYTYTQPGTYTIKLSIVDSLGCQDSTTYIVYVDDSTYINLTVSPAEICLGEYVDFKNDFAPHAISTTFDFGDGKILPNQIDPRHSYQNAGLYTAIFEAQYLICPDVNASIDVLVNDFPAINLGADKTWCPGLDEPIVLENLNNPNQILTWSNDTVASSIEVKKPGRYWATATTTNCMSSDSIWVKQDCYLNIPNSFSPNGDGNNDYFLPRDLLSAGVVDFSMKIINRWGEIIWETTSIDGRGWDGKFGGKEQATGVYVYQITAKWKNNYRNSFTGNVTLLR